jgi:hypothetical protein
MKKVFALMFAFVMTLGLVSCNSDDDSGSTPQFTIVGTWKVTQLFINGVEQNVNDYCPYKGTFQFITGGTYVENGYELDGTNCVAADVLGGTWTKSGNSYTLALNNSATSSVLPTTFSPVTNSTTINKFELNLSAGGIPTKLVFTKQ